MTSRHKGKSQGEELCGPTRRARQGQKAPEKMKLYPTAPLTGGTSQVILEQGRNRELRPKGGTQAPPTAHSHRPNSDWQQRVFLMQYKQLEIMDSDLGNRPIDRQITGNAADEWDLG